MTGNTPTLQTDRLTLRRFTLEDAPAFFDLMRDEDVNRFLPLFPLKSIEEAQQYLRDRYFSCYEKPVGFGYAVCLKQTDTAIGYVDVSRGDSFDLGYGLAKRYWNQGIVTEACRAVISQLSRSNIPYITATHDVNNPGSGAVIKKLGMTYQYSYEELWQPKNRLVIFRLYQLNLDGRSHPPYRKYWDQHPNHFIEENR